jgi:hypothetical protein
MFEKNVSKAQDIATLQELIKSAPDGAEIAYNDVTTATGIAMDTEGKARLRAALKDLKRPYTTAHARGIALSSPKTAVPIMGNKAKKVRNAADRAVKTGGQLLDQHHDTLATNDRSVILGVLAIFGSVQQALSAGSKSMAKQEPMACTIITIPLPKGLVS